MDKSALWPAYQEHRVTSTSPPSGGGKKNGNGSNPAAYVDKGSRSQPRQFKNTNGGENDLSLGHDGIAKLDKQGMKSNGDNGQLPESQVRNLSGVNMAPNNVGNRQSISQINFLFNPARQDLIGSILNNYLTYNNQAVAPGSSGNETSPADTNQAPKSLLLDATYPSYYLNHTDSSVNNNQAAVGNDGVRPRGDSFYLPPPISSQMRMNSSDYENNPSQRPSNSSRSNSIFSSLIQMPGSGGNSISDGPQNGDMQKTSNTNNPNTNNGNNNDNNDISAGRNKSKVRQPSITATTAQGGSILIPLAEFEESLGNFLALQQQDPKGSLLGFKSKNGSIDYPLNNSFWDGLSNGTGSITGMPFNGSIGGILAGIVNGNIDFGNMNEEQRRDSIMKIINDQLNTQPQRQMNIKPNPSNAKLREDIFDTKGKDNFNKEHRERIPAYNDNSMKIKDGNDNLSPISSMSSKSSAKYNDEPQSPKTSPTSYNASINQAPLPPQAFNQQQKQMYPPLDQQNFLVPQPQSQYNYITAKGGSPGEQLSPDQLKVSQGALGQSNSQNYQQAQYYPQFQNFQQQNQIQNQPQQYQQTQVGHVGQIDTLAVSSAPHNDNKQNALNANDNERNLVPAQQFAKTDDGRPLLGATKIDQLMLVIQAREKGVTNPIHQAPDGSILAPPEVKSENGIIPQPVSLVGGVDKPKSNMDATTFESENGDPSSAKKKKAKNKQCPYCFKHFTQSTHLEVHVRSHIGYKPFECSYCHKRFTQGGNLRTHLRLHTGEKPFTCDVCKRSFSRKGNLAAHKLTHENLRPYECKLDNCDKSFTQLGNLKSHQNRFHLSTLNDLTHKLAELTSDEIESLPKDEKDLLNYFKDLYKNSNKGILGRGKRIKPISELNNSSMSPSW